MEGLRFAWLGNAKKQRLGLILSEAGVYVGWVSNGATILTGRQRVPRAAMPWSFKGNVSFERTDLPAANNDRGRNNCHNSSSLSDFAKSDFI